MLSKLLLLAFGLSLATPAQAVSPLIVNLCGVPRDNVRCATTISVTESNSTVTLSVKQANGTKLLKTLNIVGGSWSGNLLFDRPGSAALEFKLISNKGIVTAVQNVTFNVRSAQLVNQDRRSIYDFINEALPGSFSEYSDTPQEYSLGPLMESYQD